MKKSSNVIAILTIFFFFSFPVIGLLVFWNDAHGKIQHRAVEFVDESFEPFYASLQAGEPNEDSSIHLRDQYDSAHFKSQTPGAKVSLVKPIESWAREEDDKGIQYARLNVQMEFGEHAQSYDVVIRRETVAPRWRYHEITPLDK